MLRKCNFSKFLLTSSDSTPDAVSNLQAVPISSTSIELSWRPPFDTHGDLVHYFVRVTDKTTGSTQDREVSPLVTSFVLDNLDIYTPYDVSVIPHNANGPGRVNTITIKTPGARELQVFDLTGFTMNFLIITMNLNFWMLSHFLLSQSTLDVLLFSTLFDPWVY